MGLLDHTLAPYLDVSTLTTTRLLLLLTDWMSWGWRCSCGDRALCCRSADDNMGTCDRRKYSSTRACVRSFMRITHSLFAVCDSDNQPH